MSRPGQRKKRIRKVIFFGLAALTAAGVFFVAVPRINFTGKAPGAVLDTLDGVFVYNNGPFSAVHGRTLTEDGYNVGLKYQCVEFIKRYYLINYGHRMPDSYGHARDFFDRGIPDGGINPARGLVQMSNGSGSAPRRGDIVVFGPSLFNRFGHVAIVARATEDEIELVQQNVARRPRATYPLEVKEGHYYIGSRRALGWLRMPD